MILIILFIVLGMLAAGYIIHKIGNRSLISYIVAAFMGAVIGLVIYGMSFALIIAIKSALF